MVLVGSMVSLLVGSMGACYLVFSMHALDHSNEGSLTGLLEHLHSQSKFQPHLDIELVSLEICSIPTPTLQLQPNCGIDVLTKTTSNSLATARMISLAPSLQTMNDNKRHSCESVYGMFGCRLQVPNEEVGGC